MPDLVQVRIRGNGPAKDHCVKGALVHEFPDKGSPFHCAHTDADAHPCQLLLHDDGAQYALLIALIGQDGEFELLAIPLHNAVSVPVRKAGLCKKPFCALCILSHWLQIRMIEGCPGLVGTKGRNALA